MGEHAGQFARLRAAIETGALPRDLGEWALEMLSELEPAAERVERRNALLRAAAERLSGSRWAKAGRLAAEIHLLASPALLTRSAPQDDDGVRALVARALAVAPAPRERRQLFRLLRGD